MDNKDNDPIDDASNHLQVVASSIVSTISSNTTAAAASALTSSSTASRSTSTASSRSSVTSAAAGEPSRSTGRNNGVAVHSSGTRGHMSVAAGAATPGIGEAKDRTTGSGWQRNRNATKVERACSNAPHNSPNGVGLSARNAAPTNRHDVTSNPSRNRQRENRSGFDTSYMPLPAMDRPKEKASPEADVDVGSIEEDIMMDDVSAEEERVVAYPIVTRATSSYTITDPSLRQPHNWQASKSTIKERLGFMFNNELLADIHFIVGKDANIKRIAAHKFVLSIGSAVFDAMFNGGLHMASAEIELPDVEPAAFLSLLWFFYTDEVNINPDTVMASLYTAKKYAVPALERACVEFLKRNLSSDNAFMLLTQARLFDEPQLAALCLEMIYKTTSEALLADGFPDIDLDTLSIVMERDTLGIREQAVRSRVQMGGSRVWS